MTSLPTRQDLRQLLANTGVCLPESRSFWTTESSIWIALALIHFTLLLGMGDLLVRFWPLTF